MDSTEDFSPYRQDGKLYGFVCVVTGASQPVGQAIIAELAAHGAAAIYACDKTISSSSLPSPPSTPTTSTIIPYPSTLTTEDETLALIDEALAAYGRLDVCKCRIGYDYLLLRSFLGCLRSIAPETGHTAMYPPKRQITNPIRHRDLLLGPPRPALYPRNHPGGHASVLRGPSTCTLLRAQTRPRGHGEASREEGRVSQCRGEKTEIRECRGCRECSEWIRRVLGDLLHGCVARGAGGGESGSCGVEGDGGED